VNRPLRRLAVAGLLLLAALLANANWVQVLHAKTLNAAATNPRPLFQRFARDRGDIRLADGTVIASSTREPDGRSFRRGYPSGDPNEYAAVTGWAGVASTSGLEKAGDPLLSGTDDRLAFSNFTDTVLGRQQAGGYIVTTLDKGAQDAAWQGLRAAGKKGAVVALDVKTGAVLALVSTPSFDPSPLASRDPAAVQKAYDGLLKRDDGPLLDRATQATYPPGSFFKVVTSAAALAAGRTPDTVIKSPQRLKLPLTTSFLNNFGGETCGADQVPLKQALKISCNTAFAQLGLDLGADRLRAQAQAFGIGMTVPGFPLPGNASSFPAKVDQPQTALSAIGQYDVRLTPLQAAMIVQSIAAGGTELAPYLVAEEHAPDGSTFPLPQPRRLGQPVDARVAADLKTMMTAVVAEPGGTANPSIGALRGLPAAGKTGTAQHATGKPPHAWFGGFAPLDDPRVAVAVIVEDGGNAGSDATGGGTAAPIAFAVLHAAVCGRAPAPAGCS